ncbi:MAG: carboxypeptidase regulatory-like domain-containing protein [Candidatus Edwardsbacteria bacterium]
MKISLKYLLFSPMAIAVFLQAGSGSVAESVAEATGKIEGRVINALTGDSLPGALVMILGKGRGVFADSGGYYSIANLPVGNCSLGAGLGGYMSAKVSDVKVIKDSTTVINFDLTPWIVAMAAMECKTGKPVVKSAIKGKVTDVSSGRGLSGASAL